MAEKATPGAVLDGTAVASPPPKGPAVPPLRPATLVRVVLLDDANPHASAVVHAMAAANPAYPPITPSSGGHATTSEAASAGQGRKKKPADPPPDGTSPAANSPSGTFAGFVAATVAAASDAPRSSVARTAAQPFSKIRGNYSWEAYAGGNLTLELPRGWSQPPRLIVQLFEDHNFAQHNRARVPTLFSAAPSAAPPNPAASDPTAGDAIPLASTVITLDGARPPPATYSTLGNNGVVPPPAVGVDDGLFATEAVLRGRRGLGKDFKVRFTYQISIW